MKHVFDLENGGYDWLLNLDSLQFSPFQALCNPR